MSKKYFRLRDTGTTFYDTTQGAGVVADRVAHLEQTERVTNAKKRNILVEVGEEEGAAAIKKQEEEFAQNEELRKLAAKNAPTAPTEASKNTAITGDPYENPQGQVQTSVQGAEPTVTPEAFDTAKILDGTVEEVKGKLDGLNADQLATLQTAEAEGKNRAGVRDAISAELLEVNGTQKKKVNLGDL